MADIYDYVYYLNGRYFGFLRKTIVNTGDPHSDLLEAWLTPTTADSDAIMVEYTYQPSTVTAVSDTLDVNSRLALAVVDYVESKMTTDPREKKRLYSKFRARIAKDYRNKIGTIPVIIPRGPGVCK